MKQFASSPLIGRWVSDPEDENTIQVFGETTIVFTAEGDLIYIIKGERADQVINMTYQVCDGVLITNQPSAQQEERTPFTITAEGKLVLEYGGSKSRYIRVST
jgi:hypothetical protein